MALTSRQEEIQTLLAAGYSQSQVARKLGISRQRVHQVAHMDPAEDRGRGGPPPLGAQAVLAAAEAHPWRTISELADLAGVCTKYARVVLYRAGVYHRNANRLMAVRQEVGLGELQ